MNGEEKWWQSKTIWGAGVALAAFALTWFGVTVTPEEQTTLVTLIVAVATPAGALVAFVLTIIGRITATKKIKPSIL